MHYVILLGMMGSGKTTLGRRAAEMAGIPFEDTDQVLVRKLGRPIHQLFQLYGEEAFRLHETKVLEDMVPAAGILSTGGGIVVKQENWHHLRRLGTTIFLDVPFELLVQRLTTAKKRRPLLEVEGWEDRLAQLLLARMPLYTQADHRIPVSEEPIDDAAKRILELTGYPVVHPGGEG